MLASTKVADVVFLSTTMKTRTTEDSPHFFGILIVGDRKGTERPGSFVKWTRTKCMILF
jgi:hypothetical protein